jgi:serine/threonine protein kinase
VRTEFSHPETDQASKAEAMNWIKFAESRYPWEREALEFVRSKFPAYEPYRAWSNFEFIADDGSINEIDLLVFSPMGFFLIEIKSRPGRVAGDAGTWLWDHDGRTVTIDNPVIAANTKAKKLRALLNRQRAIKGKGEIPFIEPLIFCSAPDLCLGLTGIAANRVCLRDRERTAESSARSGVLAAITRRECPGLSPDPKGIHDKPTAKIVSQAMDQAGIRASQRSRKVSDYLLERIIGEGPGYQDWLATHVRLKEVKRRVRLYHVRSESSKEAREKIERSALREFQLLETLQHPGVLRIYGFSEHELGPALIFEHDPLELRLDHFLAQRKGKLGIDRQLDLIRQVAEVVRFAHEKKAVHRGLAPQSILVTDTGGEPRIKLFNWQVGYRQGTSTSGVTRPIAPTSHVDRLIEDSSQVYIAPEAMTDEGTLGEHLDVFSLGALAYHIFSGEPPATNIVELNNKLRETKGLQISSVVNGAGTQLQDLVRFATHPEVTSRLDSVADFLDLLEKVEDELTAPDHDFVTDPRQATKGDTLPGDLTVLRRLGQGACSIVLLVDREGQEFVLKAASDPEHSARIRDEAEVLEKLRHQHIVDVRDTVEIGEHAGFLMRPVFANKEDKRIETLGQRLRKEGRLQIELLERFGDDLLGVVKFLEEQGIPHRDIKPDNIAVGAVGRGDILHVVLFDFSLARSSADNIRAGTSGYLDPLLALRKPPRWDLHAERYAAAATLYELSTGTLPRWGDGNTLPEHLQCEITIDPELFDTSLREPLTDFFRRAFRRDVSKRFDNAETMQSAWKQCFAQVDQPGTFSDHEDEETLRAILAPATPDTHIHELGLGTRATNALDRANILTVEDLLTTPMRRLLRLRGVGNKTRREIATAVKILRERLGVSATSARASSAGGEEKKDETLDAASLSVDLLAQRLFPKTKSTANDKSTPMARALLGLDEVTKQAWPSQGDVAEAFGVTRARVSQVVGKLQDRWAKDSGFTKLRLELAEIIATSGGAMSVSELTEALIVARGGVEDDPLRCRLALAVVRAAVEAERSAGDLTFQVRRDKGRVVIASSQEIATYAFAIGDKADKLAAEDPLVTPQRVLQRLREISAPGGAPVLSDARIVRLAAAMSSHAALSSRQELYPRNMEAARALKLSQGALYGVSPLTVNEIRERVRSRYPEAQELSDRPVLDWLLEEAGIDLRWDPTAKGVGGYVGPSHELYTVSTTSKVHSRQGTGFAPHEGVELSPEIVDARQFEERLQHGIKDGSFYTLLVAPKYYDRACQELTGRFPVELVDFEGLFIDALRDAAANAKVKWDLVVQTDAKPNEGDWNKLQLLVGRAVASVEETITKVEKPVLLIYASLLARYERMDLLERLRDKVGRRGGIPSLWILIPGEYQAMMDGKAVPILSPGQRARVPVSWIDNKHRGNGREGANP